MAEIRLGKVGQRKLKNQCRSWWNEETGKARKCINVAEETGERI